MNEVQVYAAVVRRRLRELWSMGPYPSAKIPSIDEFTLFAGYGLMGPDEYCTLDDVHIIQSWVTRMGNEVPLFGYRVSLAHVWKDEIWRKEIFQGRMWAWRPGEPFELPPALEELRPRDEPALWYAQNHILDNDFPPVRDQQVLRWLRMVEKDPQLWEPIPGIPVWLRRADLVFLVTEDDVPFGIEDVETVMARHVEDICKCL